MYQNEVKTSMGNLENSLVKYIKAGFSSYTSKLTVEVDENDKL